VDVEAVAAADGAATKALAVGSAAAMEATVGVKVPILGRPEETAGVIRATAGADTWDLAVDGAAATVPAEQEEP